MKLSTWITVSAVLMIFIWAGAESDHWPNAYTLRGQQYGYYNLLTRGFLDGHLSMKVAPDASGQLPFLLDASLYRGKYYLYFGVVPAMMVFLPYTWLTGYDLPGNAAVLIFVATGFLLTLRLYILARRQYFPSLGWTGNVCSILLIGLGSATPILVFGGGFYEAAIAAGYLCVAAMLLCLYQAIHSPRHAVPWLTAASFAAGLAIGCRPTYLVVLPILLVPVASRLWSLRHNDVRLVRSKLVRLLGAAVIPAGLVGLALMAYNHGRFGDPFEFGVKYQLNSFRDSGQPLMRAAFIWPNLKWYYLTPPVISPYFPYFMPINASDRPPGYHGFELLHGQWLSLILGLLCLVGILRLRRLVWPRQLSMFIWLTLQAFMCLLMLVTMITVRANRYVVDFQGCLVLLLALTGGYSVTQLQREKFRWGRLFQIIFCLLAVSVAVSNTLVGAQLMDRLANSRPHTYRALAYYGNYPSHWLGQLGWQRYGSYRFQVKFKPQSRVVREPLLATGSSGYSEALYAIQHPTGYVDFLIPFLGHMGINSGPLALDFQREHEIEISFGALFPPAEHPYWNGWQPTDILRARTTVRVWLDKKEIIHGHLPFRSTDPSRIYFGRNPAEADAPFSGKIQAIAYRSTTANELHETLGEFGLWRLETILPSSSTRPQPLLASGSTGHGNLLFVEYTGPKIIRFGLDQWNVLLSHSIDLAFDPEIAHRIEVFVRSQIIRQSLPLDWQIAPDNLHRQKAQLKVWLDGKLVWDTLLRANLDSYKYTATALNPQGFSTATPSFGGTLRNIPLSVDEKKELLQRNLQPSEPGIWRLDIQFPPPTEQGPQPLLASGHSGYGNLLFVKYVNPREILLGHDDWGKGVVYSNPILLDSSSLHRLEIFVGPEVARQIFPEQWRIPLSAVQAHATILKIWLDGRLVWETPINHHRDSYKRTSIGRNQQGFSSATVYFNGVINRVNFSDEQKIEFIRRNIQLPLTR